MFLLKWVLNTDAELLHDPTNIQPVKRLEQINIMMQWMEHLLLCCQDEFQELQGNYLKWRLFIKVK